jgi:hypothetical protein
MIPKSGYRFSEKDHAQTKSHRQTMKPFAFMLFLFLVLASSPSSAQFLFFDPVPLDNLDGNYRTIAACAYTHLTRRQTGISRIDQQGAVRLSGVVSLFERWELLLVDDEGGRQTRLDWSAGPYPSEHVLSTVRACAA